MVISRTPYRISFFGGGTDYPDWYLRNDGEVLSTTIDKFCYLTCRFHPPFFKYRYSLSYRNSENCNRIDEIKHPSVRETLRFLNIDTGIDVHYTGDLPGRSGMGSSSSFTVGLLNSLYALQGKIQSKKALATQSIYIEQKMINEVVGSQDQVSAAYGGLNHIRFFKNGEIDVRPLTLSQARIKELNSHIMLFYTGILRTAEKVAESYVNGIENKEEQLLLMREMVNKAINILNSKRDIVEFGELINEAWTVKKSLSKEISNLYVDDMYSLALKAGAIGGKLSGAGGGGFMFLFVPPENQEKVRESLSKFICVPINIEFNGSQIIFYDPQNKYEKEDNIRKNNNNIEFIELDNL